MKKPPPPRHVRYRLSEAGTAKLHAARTAAGLSLAALSSASGIARAVLARLEKSRGRGPCWPLDSWESLETALAMSTGSLVAHCAPVLVASNGRGVGVPTASLVLDWSLFPLLLGQRRRGVGWSRFDLASHLGVDERRVADWENGETRFISDHFLAKLEKLLGQFPRATPAGVQENADFLHAAAVANTPVSQRELVRNLVAAVEAYLDAPDALDANRAGERDALTKALATYKKGIRR